MTLLNRDQLLSLVVELKNQSVLSVYIDGSAIDPSGRQWRIALDQAVSNARDQTTDHADHQALERAVVHLDERLT